MITYCIKSKNCEMRVIEQGNLSEYRFILAFLNLLFFAFCFTFFYMGSAVAQYYEEQDFIPPSELRLSFDPDAKSYTAVSNAVYLENQATADKSNKNLTGALTDYKEALKYLNDAIQLDPRSSFLYTKLVDLSEALGDHETAQSAADTALELGPTNADAHFWVGLFKYTKGQDKQGALAEFKKATELEPEHFKAQLYLASLAMDAKDYKLAANAYSQMLKIQPYNPELRYRLGFAYSKYGEINKAIEEFRAATMINENHWDAHLSLANLYARQSQNNEAIDECMLILKNSSDPTFRSYVMLLLAQLYVANGEYDNAISICESITKGRNGRIVVAEAYYRMGSAYKEKGEKNRADENFQKSIDAYKALIEEDKKNVELNYDIAMVYDARSDYKLAEQHLGRLIALKPDEANAYNYLGYILVEQNKELELAVSYVQKAIEMEPNNGAFHDSLGWAYYKLEKLDEAITELEKAAELTPGDSDIHEHLGDAYSKKGGEFTQKAVQEWEKSLELKPWKTSLKQKLNKFQASLNSNSGK